MWERGLKWSWKEQKKSWRMSLPMWERGLKLRQKAHPKTLLLVAPHVGAWIEIWERTANFTATRSLPMWERGLK